MRYHHATRYDAPAPAVYAMLTDPVFQAQRSRAGNPDQADAKVEPSAGGGAVVTVTRRISSGLPSFVSKLAGGGVSLTETVRWPDADGAATRSAAYEVAMANQPGRVTGTMRLDPDGDGTAVTLDGEITVKLPLVGGKVERFVAESLDKLLKKEHELGAAWLAEHATG